MKTVPLRAPSSIQHLRSLAGFSWSVLVYTLAVIVWGAYVRATGSGAGCGNHWPLCNGSAIPRQPALETIIEFSHRITSGLSVILIVGLALAVFRTHPKGHLARKAAGFSVLFIFQEALIGAGLVLYGLVTHDQSSARVFSLSLHLGNTFLLTAALALTGVWARDLQPSFRIPDRNTRIWMTAALLGCLAVGITGSIAALGDTLWPSLGSANPGLLQGLRNDFSSSSPILLRLRVIHPFLAVSYGLALISGVLGMTSKNPELSESGRKLGIGLILLVVLQLSVGVTNLALLAPVWAQMVHLLLANLLWILLVLYWAEACSDSIPSRI